MKLKFYEVTAVPTHLNDSEYWTEKNKYRNILQAAEMKSTRSLKGSTKLDTIQREGSLSFMPQSVLRQAHSLFESEFSTQCDLVLPHHPVAAYVFFLVFQSLPSFLLTFLQSHVSEGSSYARCDQSS